MNALPMVLTSADAVQFFHPRSGEAVDLGSAPVELLAELRDRIRRAEEEQRVAKAMLDEALHARMDFESTLTLHAEGFVVTGKPAEVACWDVEALDGVLDGLVAEGALSPDVRGKALQTVVTLKPMAGELKKLSARFPEVEACRSMVPNQRRATVKPVTS